MPNMTDLNSDAEIMAELGRRLAEVRLSRNVGIAQLAEQTGLNRNTILNAERGFNPRLQTVVRMVRALGRLQALDGFLPPPPVSPIQLLENAGRKRRRARRATRG